MGGKISHLPGRFNVRTSEETADLVNQAIARSGLGQSEWIREALEAAARSELARQQPPKTMTLHTATPGNCTHPKPALHRLGLRRMCAACGDEVGQI
jgi:hypothetical protein